MNVKTQERIWRIWESMLTQVSGDQPYPEAVAEVSRFLGTLIDALHMMGTKETTLALLASLDEPSMQHLALAEGMAVHIGSIVRSLVRDHIKEGLAKMPQPPGGRPLKQTLVEKQRIPRLILAQIESGLSEAEAKRRVARHAGLHVRTIHRIWKQRTLHPSAKMTRQDTEELVRTFLQNLSKGEEVNLTTDDRQNGISKHMPLAIKEK